MEEHVMNMEIKVGQRPAESDGHLQKAIDQDVPIGLPGEGASQALLDDDEYGPDDDDHAKGGLKGAVARFLASFGKPKTAQGGGDAGSVEQGIGAESSASLSEASEGRTEGEGLDVTDDDVAQAAKNKRDRKIVFVSALALVAVAAAGFVFWPGSQKRVVVAEPGMSHPSVLAPAASLALVPKAEIQTPMPQTRVKGGDPMQELLALKPKDPADATPKPVDKIEPGPQALVQNVPQAQPEKSKAEGEAAKPAPSGDRAAAKPDADAVAVAVVSDPGMVGKKAERPVADAPIVSKPAQDAAPKEAPSPAKEADRLDAVRKETLLLERLTQMAALITHLNGQVNRLESDQAKLTATTEDRYADLQRRMALAESNRQIDAATRAQDPSHSGPLAVVAPKDPKAAVVLKTGPAAVAPAVETAGEKRAYRIQAASPSLAMLGTGGNDAPLEVVPGSTVPGWGRVDKIEQRGQAWVVVTTGGVIK
ncbi:hypothetical protein [Rhodoblastus sphagnicola]|nr:hypothetical protein [Rhodoblastus sphagnicola]